MIKRYNYRAYPTKQQEAYFQQVFGQCRFVFNWALDLRSKSYEEDKRKKEGTKEKPRGLSNADVSKMLTALKKEDQYAWLNDGMSIAHNWALQHLDTAFKNFFKRGTGYPQFKSKHKSGKAFSFHQGYKIVGNKISVPKSGWLKFVKDREFEGTTKTVTVKQEPSGKYYISIVVDDGQEPITPVQFSKDNIVGIDVGVVNTFTLSDGTVFNAGMDFEKEEKLLRRAQHKLSRKHRGEKGVPASNNFRKQKVKVAKKFEKIRLKRDHAVKNIIFDIVQYLFNSGYCGIALRNYNIKEMINRDKVKKDGDGKAKSGERIKRRRLNKKILGGAMGMLCDGLKQKCKENGLHVLEFDANKGKTTAKCYVCSSEDVDISLSSRLLYCKNCGNIDDIDKNASKNIVAKSVENQD